MTSPHRLWTAIVLAGQRPGVDPLAAHFGEAWKALVPVGGEPMVTHVVRTLSQVAEIGKIVVLAQDTEALSAAVASGGAADILASSDGISVSILRHVGTPAAPWPVLVTTADHPLLTSEMVRHFIAEAEASDGDVAVAMVERATMLAAYPGNKRTWLRFSDGAWSGANLFALHSDGARGALELWAEAEQDRKKAWKLFLHFGPLLALRAITRTIGLATALGKAGKRLGLSAHLVPMPMAEAAIDVDKVSDHVLAEKIFLTRLDQPHPDGD